MHKPFNTANEIDDFLDAAPDYSQSLKRIDAMRAGSMIAALIAIFALAILYAQTV